MAAVWVHPVPDEAKTSTVPEGAEMVFRYGGQRSLKTVERTIPAELPPGEYVVEVYVEEPHNQAGYYFRIMVG